MTELIAVLTISIFAVISPGPDFAMVSRNSLTLSRQAGTLTAIGIGLGVIVHVTYTIMGIGVILHQSLVLFTLLKIAGSIYLIWLGIKMVKAKPQTQEVDKPQSAPNGLAAMKMGFMTNALNPKTSIFIVSLFMQVVRADTPPIILIGYGLLIAIIHMIWFSLVARFFSTQTVRKKIINIRGWIDRFFGLLLIGFGSAISITVIKS